MFSCCCPSEQAEQQNKSNCLQQRLIETETKSSEIGIVNPEFSKLGQDVSESKEIPINKNLSKMSQFPQMNLNGSISSLKSESEQPPVAQAKNSSRSILKLTSFQENEKIKKKSDLWEEQVGTKILYFNNQKEEQMIFAFKIINIKTNENHPLAYSLNPNRNTHKIRTKPLQVSLNFVIWNKGISQTKTAIKNIENDSYIKTVFGVYKKEDEQKSTKLLYENDEINEIIIIGNNCLRLEIFDKIIISCLNEKDAQHILQFCQRITEFYELDDFSKVIFIFPADLNLSEINLILSKLLRKHLISQKLENIIKFLGFHVQLVEGDLLEPIIIVKSNLLMCQQEQIYSKQFEIKLELSIGLLMIDINYNNFKAYEKVLDSFFVDMTIIKYLRIIQFIHKQKKDYLNKLEELKLFESNQLLEIQNSSKIEQKVINSFEKCIVIKHRIKRRMGELFADYRTAQTPIEQSQKKKKEWDDDLRENDIRVTQMDKNNEQDEIDDNCNLFENIDDSYVDNASLDIITGLEFKEMD